MSELAQLARRMLEAINLSRRSITSIYTEVKSESINEFQFQVLRTHWMDKHVSRLGLPGCRPWRNGSVSDQTFANKCKVALPQ